jgi:ribosome-associated heat shock protein Hsp15
MDGFLDVDDDDEEEAEPSDKDWDNFFNDEAEGDE